MKKILKTKLTLQREQIRVLTPANLVDVVGGMTPTLGTCVRTGSSDACVTQSVRYHDACG